MCGVNSDISRLRYLIDVRSLLPVDTIILVEFALNSDLASTHLAYPYKARFPMPIDRRDFLREAAAELLVATTAPSLAAMKVVAFASRHNGTHDAAEVSFATYSH